MQQAEQPASSHTCSHMQDIMGVEIPVGTPLIYELDEVWECDRPDSDGPGLECKPASGLSNGTIL